MRLIMLFNFSTICYCFLIHPDLIMQFAKTTLYDNQFKVSLLRKTEFIFTAIAIIATEHFEREGARSETKWKSSIGKNSIGYQC